MQFKLTEEQSTKFFNDLDDAVSTIQDINRKAIDILHTWHQTYIANHKSFFGFAPMPFDTFCKKIVYEKGIHVYESDRDISFLTGTDGWAFTIRSKKVEKYTKLTIGEIIHDVNKIRAAAISASLRHSEYDTWFDMLYKMKNYMQSPYVIDDEWLRVMQSVGQNMYYYKRMMGN